MRRRSGLARFPPTSLVCFLAALLLPGAATPIGLSFLVIAIPEMERVLKPGDFVVFVGFQEQLVGRMAKVVQADLQANEVEVELRLSDGKASLVIPRSTVAYATPQPDSDEVYKRYLCTHPNRRGRLTF